MRTFCSTYEWQESSSNNPTQILHPNSAIYQIFLVHYITISDRISICAYDPETNELLADDELFFGLQNQM